MFLAIFLIGLIVVPPIVNEVEAFADDVPNYIDDIRSNKTLREYDDKYEITKKLEEQADEPAEPARRRGRRAAGGDRRRLLDRDPARDGADDHVLPAARRRANSELHPGPGAARAPGRACARSPPTSTARPAATWPGALALATAAGHLDLHRAQHPRRAVRRAARGADGVLRPDPARRLDDRRRARRRRDGVRRLPRRHDHLGGLRGRLPAGREQRLPAVRLPARGEPAPAGGDHGDPDRRRSLLGVLGALVAIPIAAAIQIALKDIWQNRPSSVVGAAGEPIPAHGGDEPPREVELRPAPRRTRTPRSSRGAGAAPAPTRPPAPATAPAAAAARRR